MRRKFKITRGIKMKKLILIAFLIIGTVQANAFAEIGAGYAKGNNDGKLVTAFGSLALIGDIDLRFEYTKNISEHPEFTKEDISRYGVFAVYTLYLVPHISITPKIGMTKTDSDFKVKEVLENVTDSSTEFTYGVELNYDLSRSATIFIGYTDYGKEQDIKNIDTSKLDNSNYVIGLKLHF